MNLHSPVDLDQLQSDLPYLLEITQWTKNFLAKPHAELGRSGPVCPFLPRALQLNTIRLAVIRAKNLEQSQIEAIVRNYRDDFLALEPNDGELAFYKAILLIFPDIGGEEAFQLIDGVQKTLKPFFVESGLMLGEFHEWNESPGLHNPDFRPLRSPIPMLAIRFMADADLPFLHQLSDDPNVRIRYLQAYLDRFGNLGEKKLSQAREALSLAQTQVTSTPTASASKCPFARLGALFRGVPRHESAFVNR